MSKQDLPVTVGVQLPDGRIEQVPVGTAVRTASGYTVRLTDLTVVPEGPKVTVFPNYGRSKGGPIRGASLKELEFYARGARRSLRDPSKARWHEHEWALLAAIEAEMARYSEAAQGRERQGDDWFLEAVRYFRSLHFFPLYAGLSDEALANRLEELKGRAEDSDDEDDAEDEDEQPSSHRQRRVAFNRGQDWEIVQHDRERVFSVSMDIIYGDEMNYRYDPVRQLERYVRISRGAFRPAQVRALPGGRESPPGVSFTLAGRKHDMTVWEDPSHMVKELNPLIAGSGYQFECVDLSPDVQVMALTGEEKRRLQKERRWRFSPS